MVWSEGYIADQPYVKAYCRELNPASQVFAAATQGWAAPDLTQPFGKVELGCGYGLTLLMEAAAFPQGRFVGIDFNPDHVTWAKQVAALARLDNVDFLPLSFRDLAVATLPDVDFISLHGVWSWIDQENRAFIADFIHKKLRPGGLAAVSYNAVPGWSRKRLVRDIMLGKFVTLEGSSADRLVVTMKFLEEFRKASGPLQGAHKDVLAHVDEVQKLPPSYLTHEYLNKNWVTFNHREVADAFSGLKFVSSAKLFESVEALNFPPAILQLLDGLPNAEREAIKDVYADRSFRSDLYGQTLLRSEGSAALEYVLKSSYALAGDPALLAKDVVRTPLGKVALDAQIYRPILARLASGPATGRELIEAVTVRRIDADEFAPLIFILMSIDIVSLALPPDPGGDRRQRCRRLNETLCNLAIKGDAIGHLVSPVSGFGHQVQEVFFFFIVAGILGKDPVTYAWRVLKSQGKRMMRDGQLLADEADNLDEIRLKNAEFETQYKARFRRLDLVA